jgi:hypothetical protein
MTPCSGVGENVVQEWSTYEDKPMKRIGVEDTISDISGSEGLGDESRTLWFLGYVPTLRRVRVYMCGEWEKICGASVES